MQALENFDMWPPLELLVLVRNRQYIVLTNQQNQITRKATRFHILLLTRNHILKYMNYFFLLQSTYLKQQTPCPQFIFTKKSDFWIIEKETLYVDCEALIFALKMLTWTFISSIWFHGFSGCLLSKHTYVEKTSFRSRHLHKYYRCKTMKLKKSAPY